MDEVLGVACPADRMRPGDWRLGADVLTDSSKSPGSVSTSITPVWNVLLVTTTNQTPIQYDCEIELRLQKKPIPSCHDTQR